MWARGAGRRRRREWTATCESLDGRALPGGAIATVDLLAFQDALAEVRALRAAAKVARARPTIVLHGQVTGTIGAVQTNVPNENTLIVATGTAGGLPGTVVFASLQQTSFNTTKTHVTVAYGSGSITPLSASTGSYMLVSYKGGGPAAHKGVTQVLRLHGSVTGGAGAYAGISSGGFSGVARLNPVTGAFSMTFTLMVKPVA